MTTVLLNDFAGHAFTLDLANALHDRGHDVSYAYCSTNLAPHADFGRSLVPVAAVRSGDSFDKYDIKKRTVAELRYGFASARMLVRRRPDVLIANNMPLFSLLVLWLAARLTGTRFVVWLQDVQSGLAASVLGRARFLATIAAWLEAFVMRRADRVVTISDDIADEVERFGVDRERLAVMENWPALDELPVRSKANAWALRHGWSHRRVAMYSGTLAKKHSPDLLLALADELPDVQVVVVSEGDGVDWLRHQLATVPRPNMSILPYQPFSELPDVLATADVLITLLNEGASAYSVPSKVLSYFCAGRAIVASMPLDNAAARAITERADAGLVVEPGDVTGFVAAARKLIEDPALASMNGAAGRRYAEANFARNVIAARFERAARLGSVRVESPAIAYAAA